MANLSKIKRDELLAFINKLKEQNKDDEIIRSLNEIANALNEKKYGLVWEKHTERVDEMLEYNIPVFEEVEERKIKADDSNDYNFLLEGDNLHSLKLLEKTHKGKIDVIYIDPPYNTGNKDFVYNDSYVDKTDGYSHSKWLSFMSERLEIAKSLLSDEGVIFISIDDNEQAQLKLLCDEVFGEENFLNIISVNMKNIAGASGGGEDKKFKKNCEYILIYAKNYDVLPVFNGVFDYEDISDLVQRYRDENISWKYTTALVDPGEKIYIGSTVDGEGNEIKIYKRIDYDIKSISKLIKEDNLSEKDIYSKYSHCIFQTAMPQSSIRPRVIEKVKELGVESELFSIEYVPQSGKNKGKLYEQFYKGKNFRLFAWLKDVSEEIDGKLYKKTLQGTYWNYIAGTKNLTKEGNIEFPNGKKPLDLIKRIVYLYPNKNLTVLDFFAGSGTTGHAVMQLNKEDGGNRKYILCTNNENNICEEVTYRRLKNIQDDLPQNLKYFKTNFIPKIENEEDMITAKLIDHIIPLIELEYMCEIDNKNKLILLDEHNIAEVIQKAKDEATIFISNDVFIDGEYMKAIEAKNISLVTIPDYYFKNELMEVGEL
ncbi:site-specific DNA-methyltransferase (adenine-specific) [Mergibacter septicus]|uniref:site-specific DNA-methyltransferase (adenine-specific) n=2 Tax=Mergibacter septicus TaxID=221402 RepID=A0A8E3SAK4_9PAST|nr:site-specific DNA-methyltransferase [Mergibacter septicus]AWX16217.1 site-specific DNA-methyltransferase (adenine-specific) [Mergibacter septicus]QDJ15469.1 site-specific DNA-methyltransferase (adenine-specific) [Mergibacter septicus]UTU48661.1 site-specific DNA-methyltransferase [Mergibacter septicus]WMR95709.1 site-specific DNA-methyltransferase [Mergibacter septicus]